MFAHGMCVQGAFARCITYLKFGLGMLDLLCFQFPRGNVPEWVQDAMKVAEIDIAPALSLKKSRGAEIAA